MKNFLYYIIVLLFFLFAATYNLPTAYAIVDPSDVPNNKFGIHIIQATPDESFPAEQLVNTNGDWGYITFLIESKDRNEGKWQEFFNDLRRRHLIPIVRLATKPVNEHWERPYEKEYEAWADFLDTLNWPVKNRYVIVYNEPNHGKEWGGTSDPASYAQVLDKTIDALKKKSEDFFVLNAGFDASAPHQVPQYFDEELFLREMNKAVPGIFNKLDGWVSHSYPNPGFVGSPDAQGRGTVRGFIWELQALQQIGLTKNLSVFITETGWKHAEGLNFDPSLPSSTVVATYFERSFQNAWSSNKIVAVTPFLLSYQEPPFDHFSFKKPNGEQSFYAHYDRILNMPKIVGQPVQENKAALIKGEVYSSVVSGQSYIINLTFKNIGQSIWDQNTKLVVMTGSKELGTENVTVDQMVEPGQTYTFKLKLKAPESGSFNVVLNLFRGEKQFDSPALEFTTEVKAPVILKIKAGLTWKENFAGNYLLTVSGATGESSQNIALRENGYSAEIEARFLLPDYPFDFILERPFYHPSLIRQTLHPGVNVLDFGSLQPDIFSTILKPRELWKLLPFST